MSLNFKVAGVAHEITALQYMDGAGDDHTITALRRGAKIIYPTAPPTALTVAISPDDIFATANSSGYAFAGPAQAFPTGGTGSYASYLWAITAQSGGATIAVNTPTSVTTTFTQAPVGHFDVTNATGTCTVTDSLGNTGVGSFTMTISGDLA